MKNVDIHNPLPSTTYRKVAMGTWANEGDPSIYAFTELDYEEAIGLSDELNKAHSAKITPTHLVSQAVTLAFRVRPELNSLVRNYRVYPRKSIDVFHQVFIPAEDKDILKKAELTGTVIRKTEDMNLIELHDYLKNFVAEARGKRSALMKTQANVIKKIPHFAMRSFLNTMSFINYGLNVSFAGIPKDPFGSVIISNVGNFGSQGAFIPLVPYARVALVVCIGKVTEKPIVKNNAIVIGKVLPVYVTIDHRCADGAHIAVMERVFKLALENPRKWLLEPASKIAPLMEKELSKK